MNRIMIKSMMTEKGDVSGYPKLMINDKGYVVLFSEYAHGVVVSESGHGGHNHAIGTYINVWVMSHFTEYSGTITLSNT